MQNQLPKWLVYSLGGLLTAFVALLVIDRAYSVTKTFRDSQPDHTISVPAEGKVKATPDQATVTIGVTTQGATPQAVQDQTTQKINKIIEAVKNEGVAKEDVVTSQYNIFPQHDYTGGNDVIKGYQADQTITVKVKGIDKSTDRLSRVLTLATDNGSNQVYGVSMGFDNPDDLRQQARKIAIENAKAKAKDLAAATGVRLGRVVSFSESGGGGVMPPYPMPMQAELGRGGVAVDKVASAPVIEPGSQDIVAEMTVIFEIK